MIMPDGLLGKSGVYQIVNIATGKIYIGSSVDLYRRYYIHYGSLTRDRHENPKLQRAWNKYGEDCFDFYIVEFLPKDKNLIREREQFWVDKVNPFYNIVRDVGRPLSQPRSKAHRKHHSESMKKSPVVQSEKYSKSQSEKMKAVWASSEYRDGRAKYYETEDVKKRMSEQSKKTANNSETREKSAKTRIGNFLSGKAFFSKRSKAPIDARVIKNIRNLYSSGKYTHHDLAEMFQIGHSTISRIVNRQSWAWVE